MRVVVLYKEQTDYARQVLDYMRDFEHETGKKLETLDPESREGVGFCQTYDILQFPTMLALSESGQLQNSWKGLPLPTISEVSYYA